jgi:putative endonuclease
MTKRTPYHLYILRCADGTLYTGITTNIDRRIAAHNHSPRGAKYTRARRPVSLVFAQRFRNRSAALIEEARIKQLSRQEKLEMIRFFRQVGEKA